MQNFPSATKWINLGTVRGTASSWAARAVTGRGLVFLNDSGGWYNIYRKISVRPALKIHPSNLTKQISDTLSEHNNIVSKQKHTKMIHARMFPYKASSSLLPQPILSKELQNRPEQKPKRAHTSHCSHWWNTAWYWWDGVPHLRKDIWRVTQFLAFQEHDICLLGWKQRRSHFVCRNIVIHPWTICYL